MNTSESKVVASVANANPVAAGQETKSNTTISRGDPNREVFLYTTPDNCRVEGYNRCHREGDNIDRKIVAIFGSEGRIDLGETLTLKHSRDGYHKGQKVKVVGLNQQDGSMGRIVAIQAEGKKRVSLHPAFFEGKYSS